MAKKDAEKDPGPSKNVFLQQKNKVRQMIFTTSCVSGTLAFFGIAFIAIGIACATIEKGVWQTEVVYSDRNTAAQTCLDLSDKPCLVLFTIPKDVEGPVYMYYTLSNFYQNHRLYISSKSDAMSDGRFGEEGPGVDPDPSVTAACSFANVAYWVSEAGKTYNYNRKVATDKAVYQYPCGLVARSVFNDTFRLKKDDSDALVEWTEKGVARREGSDSKYISKNDDWLRKNCYSLGEYDLGAGFHEVSGFGERFANFSGTRDASTSRYHCWHNVSSGTFNVWMRTAAVSDFWKLHRVIPGGLKAGKYSMVIGLNFPVASFNGKKGFVLSNATPLGANRKKLSVAFLVVGAVSLAGVLVILVMRSVLSKATKPKVEYPKVTINAPNASRKRRMPKLSLHLPHSSVHVETNRIVKSPAEPPGKGGKMFLTNFVSTSKYTLYSFVPLNLMLQFQRTANLYFLIIASLASVSIISPLGGSTFWLPLCFVLSVTAIKDGLEDYRRHQNDVEENNRKTEVYRAGTGTFEMVPWWEIKVGDVVRVTTGENGCSAMIPCDLVLLASSNVDGTAFLETANLDGETNLKLRESLEKLQRRLTTVQMVDGNEQSEIVGSEMAQFTSVIHCNPPDMMLYEFSARIEVYGEELPLNGVSSGGQFLQRSTKLKNTRWLVGVAVYTGAETKIQMNMNDPPNKVSNIEKTLNTYIFFLFGMLFSICTAGAIGAGLYAGYPDAAGAWYLMPQNATIAFDVTSPASTGVITWFTYLILLSLLIPISLYVSIEMVKTVIMLIISADREMYVEEEDLRSKARSSGLCEELGQVSYIFSDKTGTLTQNLMEFKKCSIGGVEYGQGYCEVERAISRKNGGSLPDDPKPPDGVDKGFKFVDDRLMFGKWREQPTSREIELFFVNMMVNHGVQVEYSLSAPLVPLFQAESPDEGAFVTAARNLGFFFTKRMMKEVHVSMSQTSQVGDILAGKKDEIWTLLCSNAFDNNRKRTSVVVRSQQGKLMLLVKGADTSVMPFVESECAYFDTTQSHIDKFGDQGLRTLVFAGRELSTEQWETWYGLYEVAATLATGREKALQQLACHLEEDHTQPGMVSALFDSSTPYKRSLGLHGVTALEDKLQENVGECIEQLAKAFIKIWVLTGDKVETAVNIGYATALLLNEMEPLLRLSQDELLDPREGWQDSATALELALQKGIDFCREKNLEGLKDLAASSSAKGGDEVWEGVRATADKLTGPKGAGMSAGQVAAEVGTAGSKLKEAILQERVRKELKRFDEVTSTPRKGGYALVIDGASLRAAMQGATQMLFLTVSVRCKAVMCCRVTPNQKAQVTLLVKDNMPGQITLAIGDGANDVAMIQAAHIGVGIRGKEGQQAVLAADYALPRFSFLERLLLIHGRWSYNKIGTMVCYFFYKNITFALVLFWFALANAFSAQALYDDGYQSLYNVVFTSFPVMIFAVFDRDIEPETVRAHPELYTAGQWNVRFNPLRFATFIAGSVAHSLLIFYVSMYVYDLNVSDSAGTSMGLWGSGTVVLTSVVVVVNIVVGLHTRSWSWVHWLFYGGSIVIWFVFLAVYHSVPPGGFLMFDSSDNVYYIFFELASSALYWLTVVVVVGTCTLPILAFKYFMEEYFPSIDDYYRRVVARPQDFPHEVIRLSDGSETAGAGEVAISVDSEVRGGSVVVKRMYSTDAAAVRSDDVSESGSRGNGSRDFNPLSRMRKVAEDVIRRNRSVQKHGYTRSDYTPRAERRDSIVVASNFATVVEEAMRTNFDTVAQGAGPAKEEGDTSQVTTASRRELRQGSARGIVKE